MKLHQGFSLLLAASSSRHVAIAQTTYTCPATAGGTPTLVSEAVPGGPSVTVDIPVVSDPDGLCTLVRRNATAGGTQRAPVARSYGGGDWEASAGLFAKGALGGLSIDCDVADEAAGACHVTLPPLEGEGQEYVLESFARSLSAKATAARFLEQATFGSTRESIDGLVGKNLDYEGWLAEQMYELPASSLREFYRKRVNPKHHFSSPTGAVGSGPCDIYSRWRTYAISSKDMIVDQHGILSKYLTFEQPTGVAGYAWKVDGQFRTVTSDPPADIDGKPLSLDKRYIIQNQKGFTITGDCVGCHIYVSRPDKDWITIANPAVSIAGVEGILNLDVIDLPDFKSSDLPSIESSADYPLFSEWIKSDENALLNTTSLDNGMCDGLPDFRNPLPWDENGSMTGTFPSIFAKSVDSEDGSDVVFVYDRHLTLFENTVENPLPDGGGKLVIDTADLEAGSQVKCHNAQRNFYNEDYCTLSYLETACAPNTNPKEVIVLNDANIAGIRSLTGRSLYAVTGLTLSDEFDDTTSFNAPCAGTNLGQWSRWIKDTTDSTCANVASLGSGTYKLYQDLIERTIDTGKLNDYDIVDTHREKRQCDIADQSRTYLGKIVTADGACWNHVHPNEKDVFDLTGANDSLYTATAINSMVSIASIEAFESIASNHMVHGKFGDHVEIDGSLHSPLSDPVVQTTYKTLEYNTALHPVLMCGSPQEIASDPFFGDHGFDVVAPENSGWRSMSKWELSAQKHTTWTHLAMHADDQLRMKIAWSLSQIVSVGLADDKAAHDYEKTEQYLAFYDMFVNNGFGSYRTLMKEFSFNKIMADWLSFEDNRSLQYNLDNNGSESYPDENFAREIMQLFSVGLYQLNMDGSIIYQENGNPADTYSIDDIVSYSRAWTGFVKRPSRGGTSTFGGGPTLHTLDPMTIDIDKRDWFPKSDISGGFIGDKVPLCADLAVLKHFIRKGATYRLLGASGTPELHQDPEWWAQNPDVNRLDLEASSPLYAKLCHADGEDCTFPAKVVLDENLVYTDADKSGAEYAVDTIRTVRLNVGSSKSIWYEYVRQPCVEHSFYRDAKRVTKGNIRNSGAQEENMCANPRLEAATPMCSSAGWETERKDGLIFCRYQGERVTYASASAICEANGMEQSYPHTVKAWKAGPCSHSISEYRSWANAACELHVRVDLDSGQIAIVHSPGADRAELVNIEKHVDPDSLNFFEVPWEATGPPSLNDCLAIPYCYVHSDDYCICDTDATEEIVYSSSVEVSSISDLVSSLYIGSVDPATFDAGTYTSLGNCGIQGVTVYSMAGDCATLSSDAIFAFEWHSKTIFLKNIKSVVSIPESAFQFRNPVQFISLSDPEVRDAYYETDEVLNSLFHYPSHPPFLATRMIQRFGISNPSPGFTERVATAYTSGTFGQFGSNEYGDLGAMIAAILLDRESRSVVLDADQTSGHLREPLIKVISFFRSLGLHYKSPLQIPTLMGTQGKIGQGSFENPSVFSFFLPEFTPPGGVQQAGLVAPEAMALQGDNVLFLLDAYFNTVKFGIVDCKGMDSFESWRYSYPFDCPSIEGDTSLSPASVSYSPHSTTSIDDILDELDVLLTSGRLQNSKRELIKSIVEPLMGDVAKAVRAAQQLILSTPEYHSTSLTRNQNTAREITGDTRLPRAPYKAVVVLMLKGGVDSWNMIVPIGECTTGNGYEEYVEARGEAHAIPKEDLAGIDTENQNCKKFGVNENLGVLTDLYREGSALFMANTGVIAKPMTKHDDWLAESAFRPFAHNTMQEAFFTGDIYTKHPGTGVMGRILDVLKQNGLQTSANDVAASGMSMLSGDQMFNNPVFAVSTRRPRSLNQNPTIENLIDAVKTLNGVGEAGNSVMSESWSSRVASSLFEHDQMMDIAAIPDFTIADYPVTSVKLTSSFKAVAEYMKSRHHRKANRDVFVVQNGGFDMHKGNGIDEKFSEVNEALDGFIQELKNQDLWNSTVIVMGSDFGRSMNTNSNGGTDHAWGGNYFMAGGSLIGGQIIGTFPTPLGPESDFWLKRGRWIPTTPWEAVWNGVAQWMGVQTDADLDWALPNRESFNTCDLFTDKDLFHDGTCECVHESNTQSTVCDEFTYSPTSVPTESPSNSPTGNPSTSPTPGPTKSPSKSPSFSPTGNPTADLPEDGWLVKNIFSSDTTITNFGCVWPGKLHRTFDGSTDKYYCVRTDLHDEPAGIIISPEHEKLSIVKALRLYASNSCKDCDPVSYVLEGRAEASAPWIEIHQGDLPWIDTPWSDLVRNDQGLPISSSYTSGDDSLFYSEVQFHGNGEAYLEYKLTFETRLLTSNGLSWAAIEVPGMILPPEPSASPTGIPTAYLPVDGTLVKTIFDVDSAVRNFGCNSDHKNAKAIDGTTGKYTCDRDGLQDERTGIIVSPSHSQLSIAKALRFYAQNGCTNCDVVSYILEGRVNSNFDWDEIGRGDLPSINTPLGRNEQWLTIDSTYESGDSRYYFTEVHFPSNSAAFFEYKLSIESRNPNHTWVQFGEVELPGMLLPGV